MLLIVLIAWYVVCVVAGAVVFRTLRLTLERAGHVRINFSGRKIPTSLGAGYAMLTILMALAAPIVTGGACFDVLHALTLLVLGFGMLGMLDDLATIREPGGFKGHLSRVGSGGGVSTALFKAFFGLCLALFVSLQFLCEEGFYCGVLNAFIIALSANSINLLDVRPGRAVKGFSFAFLFIFAGSWLGRLLGWATVTQQTHVLLVPYLLWTFTYARIDFRCRGMMGDAGSNVLGAVVGLLIVCELSISNRLIALALLVGFHLLCEVVSLSSIIERSPFLKRLDTLGVTQFKNKRAK